MATRNKVEPNRNVVVDGERYTLHYSELVREWHVSYPREHGGRLGTICDGRVVNVDMLGDPLVNEELLRRVARAAGFAVRADGAGTAEKA